MIVETSGTNLSVQHRTSLNKHLFQNTRFQLEEFRTFLHGSWYSFSTVKIGISHVFDKRVQNQFQQMLIAPHHDNSKLSDESQNCIDWEMLGMLISMTHFAFSLLRLSSSTIQPDTIWADRNCKDALDAHQVFCTTLQIKASESWSKSLLFVKILII